jgi:hypothetical protein
MVRIHKWRRGASREGPVRVNFSINGAKRVSGDVGRTCGCGIGRGDGGRTFWKVELLVKGCDSWVFVVTFGVGRRPLQAHNLGYQILPCRFRTQHRRFWDRGCRLIKLDIGGLS